MAYIGKSPSIGNFQVCDAISVVNGQAAYTMQVSSTNVVPESANHMLVSLNGILQKPNSSFTVSGSTITFASALATGDVIDFIMLLGNVLDLGVPSDATVTDAKANFVSTSSGAGLQIKGDGTTDGTLQLNCSQNSHGIKLASPAHSAGQSYTLTFPTGNVTADKFLKVASVSGSGTTGIGQLSFDDAGGGTHVLLSTTTVSSGVAQVDFTSGIDNTYKNYMITITDCHPVDAGAVLNMRISHSGTFQTANNYAYTVYGGESNGSDVFDASGGTDRFVAIGNIGAGGDQCGNSKIILCNPSGSTFGKQFYADSFSQTNTSRARREIIGGFYNSGTAVDGVRFFFNSGNIESGLFKLYGIV